MKRALVAGIAFMIVALLLAWTGCQAPSTPTFTSRPTSTPTPTPDQAAREFAIGLAKHLTDTGAVMYGAYWCGACNQQKRFFGDAFQYVTYVECDSRGENAQPDLCSAKGVQGYPTWEINGELYTGYMALESLAQLSGYKD